MRLAKRLLICAGMIGIALAATGAQAAQAPRPIDLRAGRLADALTELAREAGIEILFDEAMVRGQQGKSLSGRYTPRQALDLLLAGTGVGYRLSPDGAFVLQPLRTQAPPETDDGAISELLVVGRRTQNTDIRRTRNDIQPYVVLGTRDLSLIQFDSVDELARGRLTANMQGSSQTQSQLARNETNSTIDLRGIGPQRTLVLIDGRRLPGLPTSRAGFDQGDLNALPLGAIERVETVTATAGGIHGPSALGGVVNFVLRRDYRGADLTFVSGVSSRGDAARTRIEARLGFTPDDGATDVMLLGAYAKADPLQSGQRDFLARALRREAEVNPSGFLNRGAGADAVIVYNLSGQPLQFDAALGGTRLASSYSFLPLDFMGDDPARRATLASNAGTLPTSAPRGGAGQETSLLAGSELGSALFNVRRRFSSRVEVFVDGLYLVNRAEGYLPMPTIRASVHADAVSNPFNEAVAFVYPASELYDFRKTRLQSHRVTAGLIAQLPFRWQGTADYTRGASSRETRGATPQMINRPTFFGYGVPGPGGLPPIFPLGDGATLMTATAAYATTLYSETKLKNRFQSVSVRAAGPLAQLPGGALTLTVLGEVRREHMPEGRETTIYPDRTISSQTADRVQLVRSAYGELRAPIIPRHSSLPLVRGLELQIALRRDYVRNTFPENVLADSRFRDGVAKIDHRADVFTVGARMFPAPWVMLRASVATGEAPPSLQQLQERATSVNFDISSEARDPLRGNRPIHQDGPYLWIRGGNHDIRQEKGQTTSVGIVLNPDARDWPRLSIDLSRVEVRGEIIPFTLGFGALIAAEALYPDRISREPLSAADAARGYTAGRFTELHFGLINGGRTVTDSVDVQGEWTLPPTSYGQVRLYGAATWQPRFQTRTRLGGPMIERSGYLDGPLPLQGYAGAEWIRGALSLDLNVQVNDRRHVTSAAGVPVVNAEKVLAQGSDRVPARTYFDLAARRTFELPAGSRVRSADVTVGVQNLFDRSPPILSNTSSINYDLQGDPRRRRFHLKLSAKF